MKSIHCIHGTHGVQTLAFNFAFECRLLSSQALSRVVSPNRTHVLCCCSRWGGGGRGTEGGGGGGAGYNRLVTSIGELALRPLPCHPSPGGDAFGAWDLGCVSVMTGVNRVVVASGVSRQG